MGQYASVRTACALGVLALILCVGSSTAQGVPPRGDDAAEQALVQQVVGCYVLAPGAWQSDDALRRIQRPPRGRIAFELRPEVLSDGAREAPYRRVIADSIPEWGRSLFTSWIRRRVGDDEIEVSRPLPLAGFSLRLRPRGADLHGTITAFTDVIPADGKPEASAPVTARRTSCRPRS